MRILSLFGPTAAELALDFRLWLIVASLLPLSQCVNFDPVTVPNLDLTKLGRVALTGDFDAISLYSHRDQNENGFSTNGSQSIITESPNGNYAASKTADGYIKGMCPFVMKDGKLAGVVLGGNFTSLGGIEAQGAVLFDPTTSDITPLTGLSGQVSAIFCDQDTNTVYVGGDFRGANSSNAIAWVGMSGWANLPFAGFNGPVSSIAKAKNGNIIFGGSFTGLGNTTTPVRKDQQQINLSTANITANFSSSRAGFDKPGNVICTTQGQEGAGSTWLIEDNHPGSWQADFQFGFEPTLLRVRNTHLEGRGTKTFRFTAIPINGIMNFTFKDPNSGEDAVCDARCPLSNDPATPYQDFHFVNRVGMSSFRIDVSDWYGEGGGLNGVELYQNDTFAYAVSQINEPTCANIEFASESTATGPWVITPSMQSTSPYLTAHLHESEVGPNAASVVFKPDIKQSGNYSVKIFTPGCLQDHTCDTRGIANVTGIFATETLPSVPRPTPTDIYQTNDYDKYDEIYYGPVDANSDTFRPTITLTPSLNNHRDGRLILVAQRVLFMLTNSTGGLNGLFEFNPNQVTIDTDYSNSTVDKAGTDLDAGATITSLTVLNDVTYVAGNFSAKSKEFQNVFAISNGNSTALPHRGLNAQVFAVLPFGDILYFGGNFTSTADQAVDGLNNVAAFNTINQSWQPLGAGVRGRVNSIVPLVFNTTQDKPETCITINGDFDQIKALGSGQPISVKGFAIWVPSRQNWLQNLDLQTQAIDGKLSAAVNSTDGTQLLAGALSAQDMSAADAVYLRSSPVRLDSVGVKIQPRQLSASSKRKRAVSGQNVTGVVTGLFHKANGHNITILGGHFAANATNGTAIDNLAFINDTGSVSGVVGGLDVNSVFLTLAAQEDLLYAGGTVSGKVNNNDVNGLIVYDLAKNDYAPLQPPPFAGSDVAVNVITFRPGSSQVFVGGNFQNAGALPCPSVCVFDNSQWSPPGIALGGSVGAMVWQGKDRLIVGGNLTVDNQATSLAIYDTKKAQWTAIDGASSDVPGPVTALSRANSDVTQFWVSGKSTNGSAFLMKYTGSKFAPVGDVFGDKTTIRGLSVLQLSASDKHAENDLVGGDMTLLITGELDLPGFGNASAALFNGTTFAPFILSTSGNSPGSLSQLFSEVTMDFTSSARHMAVGFVVLIALACALGATFLLVVGGILIERYRRKLEGYTPAPTTYFDKTSNMGRIPPEYLFGRIGQRGPVDAPML